MALNASCSLSAAAALFIYKPRVPIVLSADWILSLSPLTVRRVYKSTKKVASIGGSPSGILYGFFLLLCSELPGSWAFSISEISSLISSLIPLRAIVCVVACPLSRSLPRPKISSMFSVDSFNTRLFLILILIAMVYCFLRCR